MHNTFFDWFNMDLPLFLRDSFRFVLASKKRSRLILGDTRILYLIFVYVIKVKFIITPQIG